MRATVRVIQEVIVEYDPARFTPEFMAEFRDYMYPFRTVDDHVRHLAQLYIRGIADNSSSSPTYKNSRAFIEGYGEAKDFGISFDECPDAQEEEIIEKHPVQT